jgi:hypothetical protein
LVSSWGGYSFFSLLARNLEPRSFEIAMYLAPLECRLNGTEL